jgi:hypothetical protein
VSDDRNHEMRVRVLLDGVFVAARHIGRVLPARLAGADFFVCAIFTWSQPTFANVYQGIGQR